MSNEQKIVFYAIGFPISCCPAIMLLFDNKFFKFKTHILKYSHYIK